MEESLTDANFEEKINVEGKLVIVDFFATWCEPCKVLAPIIEKVAENFKEKVVLMKANLDDTPLTAQKFEIEKIPTVVIFKNSEPINGFVGLIPEASIKEWLENIIEENK